MIRPVYETALDRKNEESVCQYICQAWKATATTMPQFSAFDRALRPAEFPKAGVKAMVEIKCRKCESKAYDTYMISLAKWKHGVEMSSFFGLPHLLVVSWLDSVGYVRAVKGREITIAIGGRKDRGDPRDIELVALIPVSDFTMI